MFFITTDGAGEYVFCFPELGDNYVSFDPKATHAKYVSALDDYYKNEFIGNENGINEPSGSDMANTVNVSDSVQAVANVTEPSASASSSNEFVDVVTIEETQNAGITFTVGDLFAFEQSGDGDGIQKLLPELNRIACSSHLLDKVCVDFFKFK